MDYLFVILEEEENVAEDFVSSFTLTLVLEKTVLQTFNESQRWVVKKGGLLRPAGLVCRTKTRLSRISDPALSSLQSPEKTQGWDQDSKELSTTDLRDYTIKCSICKETFPLYLIYYHKQQHRALTILGYDEKEYPSDMKSLAFRRIEVISNLIKASKYTAREKEQVNCSYELLKEILMSSDRYTRKEDVENIGKSSVFKGNVTNQFIKAIATCQDQNVVWKNKIEDTFTVIDNYGGRPNTCFIGLFDGFHGVSAAQRASEELSMFILDEVSKVDTSYKINEDEKYIVATYEKFAKQNMLEVDRAFSSALHDKEKFKKKDFHRIHASYAKAFMRLDRLLLLGTTEFSKVRWSGCTAVTCLLEGSLNANDPQESKKAEEEYTKCSTSETLPADVKNKPMVLHVANLGDIHAVLCRNGKSYRITKEHSTANNRERVRVSQAGGSISKNRENGLLEGITKCTRGFGCHGDPKLKRSYIPAPYAVSIPLDNHCQFLVLASSGLWDVIRDNEAVAIAQKVLFSFLSCDRLSSAKDARKRSIKGHRPSSVNTEEEEAPVTTDTEDTTKNDATSDPPSNPGEPSPTPEGTQKEDDPDTVYNKAAAFVSNQLVKSALLGGSRGNITVMVVLFQGCLNLSMPTKKMNVSLCNVTGAHIPI
ncbi:protein phosphatase 2C-like domain-containing protein 1 [Lissotriton helveticus]